MVGFRERARADRDKTGTIPVILGDIVGFLDETLRRVRRGKPIVVVSGLPRSGTSMAMKMLEAGGVPILTDGVRTADISNPKGYYEYEPVKELDKGGSPAWLPGARGKAVKIISFLLTWLPETYDYHVIFMQRDLEEAIASQNEMLARHGETGEKNAVEKNAVERNAVDGHDEPVRRAYEEHLQSVARFLAKRSCFSTLTLQYHEVVERPRDAALRIRDFLGLPLDVDRMAAVADPALYRNRHRVEA